MSYIFKFENIISKDRLKIKLNWKVMLKNFFKKKPKI